MEYKILDGDLLKLMITYGAKNLGANVQEVNDLNVFPVPDGDTGDNMKMTISGGANEIVKVDSNKLSDVVKVMSHGMLLGARGNSGVILSQFFAGMSKKLSDVEEADVMLFTEALDAGVKQAYKAVLKPTEGTILTVLRESIEVATKKVTPEMSFNELLDIVIDEMTISLDNTPNLLPVLKEAGVIDSGGAGLLYIFKGFKKALNGEIIEETANETTNASDAKMPVNIDAFGPDSIMEFGYCTELLIRLQNAKCDIQNFDVNTITEFLETIGNSIVAFKQESIVKLHVHTMTPEKVLAFCRQFGEFLTIKIENMSVQHNESSETHEELKKGEPKAFTEPKKNYGIVTVANGEGVKSAFMEMGVDVIVDGGQTHNPSTKDFLDAFEKVNAETIFVFPNNGNIIMAAKQAGEIYENAKVIVIENKDLGSGYSAIPFLNQEDDLDTVLATFDEFMNNITTACISTSIRDAELNNVAIKSGEFIGFSGKTMLYSSPDMNTTAKAIVDSLLSDGSHYMLTVFLGDGTTMDDQETLSSYVKDKYPDVETYFILGGQEVYTHILIAG